MPYCATGSFDSAHVTNLAFLINIIAPALVEARWDIWVMDSGDRILDMSRRRPID